MKFKQKNRPYADLDVTSFSDVAFLLIIFFILTTTFVKPFGHKLNIPSGTSDVAKKQEKQLTLVLKAGQILYGEKGDRIPFEELRRRLFELDLPSRTAEQRMVIVDCNKDVPYEEYFQVVMVVSQAGGVLALLEDEEGEKK